MRNRQSVSVIIPCFNHGSFLAEAVSSVTAQDHAVDEVIVVDDGSTDMTPAVCAALSGVRTIRTVNRGLAAARNEGLGASRSRFVVFLDADDRLLPSAVRSGLACMNAHDGLAFVSGEHRYINKEGAVTGTWQRAAVASDHYVHFLRGNYVGMGATVMYRRDALDGIGGFDERLDACEDYDVYLRLSRTHPVAAHDVIVAEYRRYRGSMSDDPVRMLRSAVCVLQSQRPHVRQDAARRQALADGLKYWRTLYGRDALHRTLHQLTHRSSLLPGIVGLLRVVRYSPATVFQHAS